MVFDKIKSMLGLGGNDTVAEQEEVEVEDEDPEPVDEGVDDSEEVKEE